MPLLASPGLPEPVAYQILDGSYCIDDCLPCGRPTVPVPITGTFSLGELDAVSLYQPWRVDDLQVKTSSADVAFVVGAGIYRQGGEVALLQDMFLETTVYGTDLHIVFTSGGLVPVGGTFPRIEIDLAEQPPINPFHTYSIHLVAAPEGAGLDFRRGDSNDDGVVDISDAVNLIFWLFAEAEELPR